MARVIAEMVRWMRKRETFLLPYPMQFVGFVVRFLLKRTDHDRFCHFIALTTVVCV